jgi:hypothetical protein
VKLELLNQIAEYLQLDKKEYIYGVNLLSHCTKNKGMVGRLMRSSGKFNIDFLHYELEKVLIEHNYERQEEEPIEPNENGQEPTEAASHEPIEKRSTGHDTRNHSEPICKDDHLVHSFVPNPNRNVDLHFHDRLDSIKQDLAFKYKNRSNWQSKLMLVPTNEERKDLAKSIVEIQPKLEKLLEIRDWMLEHKQVHPSLIKKEMSADNLREVQNARSNVSRYKKKVSVAKSLEEKKRAQDLLDKHIENLKNLTDE